MTTSTKQDIRMTSEYQRDVRDFVSREFGNCASTMVSEISAQSESFPDYEEEIMSAWQGMPDYETEAEEYIHNCMADDDLTEYIENNVIACADMDSTKEMEKSIIHYLSEYYSHEEFCAEVGTETEPEEVYEHWIINSSMMVRDLKANNQRVLGDFFGFDIWCRTCTGQAIAQDGVICDIYDAMKAYKP